MEPLVTVHCVTINALDPAALAGFWARLVGGSVKEVGNHFVLVEPGQGRIPLLFQQTDEPSSRPGYVHLDCTVADREAAITEIVGLGGTFVERRSDGAYDWVVMTDPEGNPFCI